MKWLIWSLEHNAWWMPASRGYTPSIGEAGRYGLEEARKIVADSNRFAFARGRGPEEAMIVDPDEEELHENNQ